MALPLARLAEPLIQAHAQGSRFAARPETGPDSDAMAYAVQAQVWHRVVGTERPRAWKVGAASRDAEPLAAPVFPRGLATSPARFSAGSFGSVAVEAEIAFRFGRDLPATDQDPDRATLLAAIASAHVAMELVDTRLADPEAAGPQWRLADSLLNGGLVIGEAIPDWQTKDFSAQAVRILVDDAVLAQAPGAPPLGDLLHCLPWWIRHIGGVRAGDLVTTGAWSGAHPVPMPATVTVEFPGLGSTRVRLD
jgi:2-keto-4-pentenoate hydratase